MKLLSNPILKCPHCNTVGDVATIMKSNQLTAWCRECGCFIKNIPYKNTDEIKFYFGKYKGELINKCTDLEYLRWFSTLDKHSEKIKKALSDRIKEINTK